MPNVTNPVLPGFHPDPSILRVGDEYFIANSTFEWYPGVEISRSRDLITWETVPSPLSKKKLLDMEGCLPSCGVWAPCLSWSDGLFWLIYTNVRSWNSGAWKDTPNFLTTAPTIEGPWSDPVYLNSSGFDPSLFHDDDGTKWLVNMEWDYRQIGKKQFTGILLQKYSPAKKKLIGPVRKIFSGSHIGLVEGPHIYKRNNWYYLLTAEGGTWMEHSATVARSRKIDGPYEIHPHNPLISSYGHPELSLQKAGHASWCDTPEGRTYLAFLCGRPIPGTQNCPLGRETSIVELEWHDDWPYVKHAEGGHLTSDGIARNYPYDQFEPPIQPTEYREMGCCPPATHSVTYTFDTDVFHHDFKTLRTERDPSRYSLTERPGYLRLRGGYSPISCFGQTLLARRQTDFAFKAETKIEYDPSNFQQLAGLTWRYDERNQYLLAVSHDDNNGRVLNVLTFISGEFVRSDDVLLPEEGPIWLGLTVNTRYGRFRYSVDGKNWVTLRPELDAAILSDEHDGLGFTGAFVGMFCVDTERYAKSADFEYFTYTVL